MKTSIDPKILDHKASDIIDTTTTPMGAKRQEDMTTKRLTDNTTATPGPKNDLPLITPPRQAFYGTLVGRETIALMGAFYYDTNEKTQQT
jgi:hypothetical protein